MMYAVKGRSPTAKLNFAKALSTYGIREKIVIDKSVASILGIRGINKILKRSECQTAIAITRSKFHNNIIKQDHRSIKRRTGPMLGVKSFSSASATLQGIEATYMIRKKQFNSDGSGFVQFASPFHR